MADIPFVFILAIATLLIGVVIGVYQLRRTQRAKETRSASAFAETSNRAPHPDGRQDGLQDGQRQPRA